MKRTIAIVCALLAMLTLTACNTMHGFGKDVQKTGEAIQKGADK